MRTRLMLKLFLALTATVATAEVAEVAPSVQRGRPDNVGAGSAPSRLQNVINCSYQIREVARETDGFYPHDIFTITKPITSDSPEKAIVLDEGTREQCETCSGLDRAAGLLLPSGAYSAPYTDEMRARALTDGSDYVGLNIRGTDTSNLFVLQMDDYLFAENRKDSFNTSFGVSVFWPHMNQNWQQNVAKERALYNNVDAVRATEEQESVMVSRVESLIAESLENLYFQLVRDYQNKAGELKYSKSINESTREKLVELRAQRATLIDTVTRQSRSLVALKEQLTPDAQGLIRASVERDIRTREAELTQLKQDLHRVQGTIKQREESVAKREAKMPEDEQEVAEAKAKFEAALASARSKLNPACAAYWNK
jgi:hypothetical protein